VESRSKEKKGRQRVVEAAESHWPIVQPSFLPSVAEQPTANNLPYDSQGYSSSIHNHLTDIELALPI
jgi:hypothetical protein